VGFYSGSTKAGPLRLAAVVGVGHHPDSFGCTANAWDVEALRQQRRRDFLTCDSGFLDVFCDSLIPQVEEYLGMPGLPMASRAILGCSLSSLFAQRLLFLRPRLFGKYILGSPSLHLAPDVFELAKAALSAAEQRPASVESLPRDVGVIFVFGEGEDSGPNTVDHCGRMAGNGIPDACRKMAGMLQSLGLEDVEVRRVAGESHDTLKPALISQGFTWLEKQWLKPPTETAYVSHA
ncbi:unnamed protein product, partial [Polarella glacialis]